MALRSAVFLANTAVPHDTLTTEAELESFYVDFAYSGTRTERAQELADVRAIRTRLLTLLTAGRDEAADLVNDWLAEAQAVPQLRRHDGSDWHVHAVAENAPLAVRILVETAMAMIDVIRTDEMNRLSRCAATDCTGVVLDLSRNRSRRFCSSTCGNRAAQAAHRARATGKT